MVEVSDSLPWFLPSLHPSVLSEKSFSRVSGSVKLVYGGLGQGGIAEGGGILPTAQMEVLSHQHFWIQAGLCLKYLAKMYHCGTVIFFPLSFTESFKCANEVPKFILLDVTVVVLFPLINKGMFSPKSQWMMQDFSLSEHQDGLLHRC